MFSQGRLQWFHTCTCMYRWIFGMLLHSSWKLKVKYRSQGLPTVDGWNLLTSWGWQLIPLFTVFFSSQVVRIRDFWSINSSDFRNLEPWGNAAIRSSRLAYLEEGTVLSFSRSHVGWGGGQEGKWHHYREDEERPNPQDDLQSQDTLLQQKSQK